MGGCPRRTQAAAGETPAPHSWSLGAGQHFVNDKYLPVLAHIGQKQVFSGSMKVSDVTSGQFFLGGKYWMNQMDPLIRPSGFFRLT